ncbi:MAG: hypothetical protein V4629_03095 [Pseudomonadota bacterium]
MAKRTEDEEMFLRYLAAMKLSEKNLWLKLLLTEQKLTDIQLRNAKQEQVQLLQGKARFVEVLIKKIETAQDELQKN